MTRPGTDPFEYERSGSSVRDQVRDLKDQAIEQGRTSLRDARDRAASSLGESKSRVADQIGAVAQAFRQAGDQLRDRGEGNRIAGLTDAMARQADQAADYLRRADRDLLRQDVERLTRRQPALVLGGAFVAGLIGARFLKSSERRRFEERYGDEGEPVYRSPRGTVPAGYANDYESVRSGYGSETGGSMGGRGATGGSDVGS